MRSDRRAIFEEGGHAMILNLRQLNRAKRELARLQQLKRKTDSMIISFDVVDVVDASFMAVLDEQVSLLEASIAEYNNVTRSEFPHVDKLLDANQLPELLIKGRLATGRAAENISRRTSVQNIDRHEKSNYSNIRLEDALRIANLLAEELSDRNELIRRKRDSGNR
jgi:hypothetical protein